MKTIVTVYWHENSNFLMTVHSLMTVSNILKKVQFFKEPSNIKLEFNKTLPIDSMPKKCDISNNNSQF